MMVVVVVVPVFANNVVAAIGFVVEATFALAVWFDDRGRQRRRCRCIRKRVGIRDSTRNYNNIRRCRYHHIHNRRRMTKRAIRGVGHTCRRRRVVVMLMMW